MKRGTDDIFGITGASLPHSPATINDLKLGMHICQIFQTEGEYRDILVPFLRQGLEKNEKIIYKLDLHTNKDIHGYLTEEGFDAEHQFKPGQFSLLTQSEPHRKSGVFDPDRTIHLLELETEKAFKEGYSGLRIIDEMTWASNGLPGSERLIAFR